MKIRVKLFDIYIFLIALLKSFGLDSGDPLYFVAFVVGLAAIFVKMMNERFTLSELMALGSILAFAVLNFLLYRTTQVLFTAIALCGLKNVDLKRVVSISFWVRGIIYGLVVVIYLLGFVEENTVEVIREGEYITRHMFCYSHPNLAHFMFAIIVIQGLYLYNYKINPVSILVVLGLNFALFGLTYSRTGFYSTIIGVLLFTLVRYQKFSDIVKWCAKNAYILLLILTVATGFLYDELPILQKLDKLMTGRLYYNNIVLSNYQPGLFGVETARGIIIDNGYLALLYTGGILIFLWFSYFIIKLCNKLSRENKVLELTLILCFLIYCFAENLLISVSVNISLVFIAEVIFKSSEGNKNEDSHRFYPYIQPKG